MIEKIPMILVIEDEISIRRFLKTAIVSEGYEFSEAKTGSEGINIVRDNKPSIVLLDLGLPDIDGLNVIKSIRAWSTIPIVILSARDQEQDKVQALDAGADDYLTKPFSIVELNARMRVALRHALREQNNESPIFVSGDFHVNLEQREVRISGNKVQLSPIQYNILSVLVRKENKLVTHKEILREVWGNDHTDDIEYLRIYIYQLRHKIEKKPSEPQYLLTEPGIGYRLVC
jgi:two-component system KDP operon response regulator KdpE